MTAYSLRIVVVPNEADEATFESGALRAKTAQSLPQYADRCGPYGLAGWAEPRGHTLYYVDNCWVRARVRGSDIPAFFADVLNGEPTVDPEIEPDQEYLIEAEEY